MAGMKQLSAGSSQILMMMFRDKNNAPIKADSVHVKGSIFTGSSKPFEFEVNKGVCTNCKIQNDMLLFNIVPLLGLGQMQVYTQTYLGDAKAITGTYVSENQQKLGVEVVNKGTFLSDRQGAMWVDVYLPIEINDAAQIPWVPAGADEQWVKDYLDKYVKTPAFAAVLANLAVADNTLSNVDAKDFEGDIKPGFVHTLIKERFYAGQQTLIKRDMFTKSAILLSGNETVLRFTINKADTKIPVGVFKRNHFLKNNNAWYDAGSANKEVQGDIAILKSFKGKLSYSVNVFNEQNTDNTVEFWLARVEADGTFTKIADSVLSTTVKKNTLPANTNNQKTIVAFEHDFKKGESYRLFAKSNKDDGAFIQVNAGSHVAMVEVIVDVKYITEIPQDIIHANNIAQIKLMDGDVEVQDTENYTIQIDVKTGAVTIKKK